MNGIGYRAAGAIAAAAALLLHARSLPSASPRWPIDLHSALALTQAHLYGTTGVIADGDRPAGLADLLLLVARDRWQEALSALAALTSDPAADVTVAFTDEPSGYVRVAVPLDRLRSVTRAPWIERLRVDGLATYETRLQQQPLSSVGFPRAPGAPSTPREANLAPLDVESAQRVSLNGDAGMGASGFRESHPTFDGRGVTIGVLESTFIPVDHPAFAAPGLTLEGHPRRKILRYLEGVDRHGMPRAQPDRAFSTWSDCRSAVCRLQGRVVRLPAPGRYRSAELVLSGADVGVAPAGEMRFLAVHRHEASQVLIDGNQDLDFSGEPPLTSFNDAAWDARSIVALTPHRSPLVSAVVTLDARGDPLALHPFTGAHATMTASVAAGSGHGANLAAGVAPNASLVFADVGARSPLLSQVLEGLVALLRDPDVDLVNVSLPVSTPLGTLSAFDSVAIDRITLAYRKPVIIGAGNVASPLFGSPAPGGLAAMSVGQYVSPETAAALFGFDRPEAPVIGSTVSPLPDGAGKPDVLAASRRIAAAPCNRRTEDLDAGRLRLPACYDWSSGTSAAAPAAAGAIALLLSAARQRGWTPAIDDLRAAVLDTARPIPGLQPHAQGAGLIDVPRAWDLLQRRQARPSLSVAGELRHALAPLLQPARPAGLILVTGSEAPETMTIAIEATGAARVQRLVTALAGPLTVTLPPTIDLNRDRRARVPVTVTPPPLSRIRSARLTFSADRGGRVLARMLAIAARPAPLASPGYDYAWTESVELESFEHRLVSVLSGTSGLLVEADLKRGDAVPLVVNPLGLTMLPGAYWSGGSVFATPVRSPPGRHAAVILDPADGSWGIASLERSSLRRGGPATDDEPVRPELRLRVTAFGTACTFGERRPVGDRERIRVGIRDLFALPRDGGVLAAPATADARRLTLRDELDRQSVDVHVAAGTALLRVETRVEPSTIQLQLFDCTQGHCLSKAQTTPGSRAVLNVRQPSPGLWTIFPVLLASNAAPAVVDVSVTTAASADLVPLRPAVVGEDRRTTLFEGSIRGSGSRHPILLLRTDSRAATSPEGWGAVSACTVDSGQSARQPKL